MAGLTANEVQAYQQRLRERRETLRGVIHDALIELRNEADTELAGYVHDSGDESIAELLRDITIAARARELGEMQDVEAALARIGSGTYGVCVDCRNAITRERLDAYPTAKRCVICQGRYEQRGRAGRDATPSL